MPFAYSWPQACILHLINNWWIEQSPQHFFDNLFHLNVMSQYRKHLSVFLLCCSLSVSLYNVFISKLLPTQISWENLTILCFGEFALYELEWFESYEKLWCLQEEKRESPSVGHVQIIQKCANEMNSCKFDISFLYVLGEKN